MPFRNESLQAINCTSTDKQTHNNQQKIHTKKTQTLTIEQTSCYQVNSAWPSQCGQV